MPETVNSGPFVTGERTRAMSLPTVTPWVQALLLLKVIRSRRALPQFTNWLPLPVPATAEAMMEALHG